MRSRYAAFALGLGEYLVQTLASAHEDATDDPRAREALVHELARAKDGQRFLGLTILSATENGSAGEVLFHARIFSRGRDQSFAELSSFVRENGAWKYAAGILVPGEELPSDLAALTPETVRARAG